MCRGFIIHLYIEFNVPLNKQFVVINVTVYCCRQRLLLFYSVQSTVCYKGLYVCKPTVKQKFRNPL